MFQVVPGTGIARRHRDPRSSTAEGGSHSGSGALAWKRGAALKACLPALSVLPTGHALVGGRRSKGATRVY